MAAVFRLLVCVVLCQHACYAWNFLSRIKNVFSGDRCFPDMYPDFQCYGRSMETHWLLPDSPEDQRIRFELYTPAQRTSHFVLNAMDPLMNIGSGFDANGQVAFIIHGFTQSSTASWVTTLKHELLNVGVYNVIAVNWSRGARAPNYPKAVANARVVGAHLATLIRTLGVSPGNVHIIGHSLGAQIAGFAGAKFSDRSFSLEKVGRVTGLDPAGPSFEIFDTDHKLDSSDAAFVDVIHTDSRPTVVGGLGVTERSGHVDFYPNGGRHMPGCELIDGVEAIPSSPVCSHQMSVEYFIASIGSSNPFTAFPCDSRRNWETCTTCGLRGCNRMGYYATPMPYGLFVLTVGEIYPFAA